MEDRKQLSIAQCHQYASAEITAEQDSALTALVQTQKAPLAMAQIQQLTSLSPQAAAIVSLDKVRKIIHKGAWYNYVEPVIHYFQFGTYEPDAPHTLDTFMSPLIDGAFAPDKTQGNEIAAVKQRITLLENMVPVTAKVTRMIQEFVDLLLSSKPNLVPTDVDEIYERQPRPSQQQILESADSWPDGTSGKVRSFVKSEAYQLANDPRVITTIHSRTKKDYSAYMYALADYVKTAEWYAFGKSGEEIAQRVADIASNARSVSLTDFSRFDGTVGLCLRDLEKALIQEAFAPEYVNRGLKLHNQQQYVKGITRTGYTYTSGPARLSGSPETSIFNTIGNAFVNYMALRAQYSPEEAYAQLGIYGGDDGLTADITSESLEATGKSIGMRLVAVTIPRGSMGVKFLARVYGPAVWNGSTSTCCDLIRQLTKFHTCANITGFTPLEKLYAKAQSWICTDPNTPIIGPFCQYVLATVPPPKKEIPRELQRFGVTAGNTNYPNPAEEWMDGYALSLDLDPGHIVSWLDTKPTSEQLLRPPIVGQPTPITAKRLAIVDGKIVNVQTNTKPAKEPIAKSVLRSRASPSSRQRTAAYRAEKEKMKEKAPMRPCAHAHDKTQ